MSTTSDTTTDPLSGAQPFGEPPGRTETQLTQVLNRLEQLVLEDLEPHHSLPAEAELARNFGVSRLTVREAIKVLSGRGLIEVSQGRRPIVAEPSGASIGTFFSSELRRDPSALLDLLEVRQALELKTAELAARKASRAGIRTLEASIARMHAAEDAEAFHEADVHFHEALALVSGNRMLSFLIEALETPLRDSFVKSYEGFSLRGMTRATVLASHEAIVKHVRARDETLATEAMRQALKHAELDLKAVLRRNLDGAGDSDTDAAPDTVVPDGGSHPTPSTELPR